MFVKNLKDTKTASDLENFHTVGHAVEQQSYFPALLSRQEEGKKINSIFVVQNVTCSLKESMRVVSVVATHPLNIVMSIFRYLFCKIQVPF